MSPRAPRYIVWRAIRYCSETLLFYEKIYSREQCTRRALRKIASPLGRTCEKQAKTCPSACCGVFDLSKDRNGSVGKSDLNLELKLMGES